MVTPYITHIALNFLQQLSAKGVAMPFACLQ